MLIKEANKITGGLSKPSKMPGPAYNLPAVACITGAKLVKIPGSVCAGCYALKGRYRFKNVQDALQRRLQAITGPRWVEAMVTLIKPHKFFRWHVSTQKHTKVKDGYDRGTLFYYTKFEPVVLNKEYIKYKDKHEKHAEVKMISQIGNLLSKAGFDQDNVEIQGGKAKKSN